MDDFHQRLEDYKLLVGLLAAAKLEGDVRLQFRIATAALRTQDELLALETQGAGQLPPQYHLVFKTMEQQAGGFELANQVRDIGLEAAIRTHLEHHHLRALRAGNKTLEQSLAEEAARYDALAAGIEDQERLRRYLGELPLPAQRDVKLYLEGRKSASAVRRDLLYIKDRTLESLRAHNQ